MSQPNALYISPVLPSPSGTGLAIRGYHVLRALASKYAVHLLVVGQMFSERLGTNGLGSCCRDVAFLPVLVLREPWVLVRQMLRVGVPGLHYRSFSKPAEWIYLTERRLARLAQLFRCVRFDLVHVHRLYTFPVHERFQYSATPGRVQLDLDDIESKTRRRLSLLYACNGDTTAARALSREAALYEPVEREALAQSDRVFTCSVEDRDFLQQQYPSIEVEVLPNVARIPEETTPTNDGSSFVFLFVGAMNYYPNQDAVLHFCRDILPEIRRVADRDFTVRIVGRNPSAALCRRMRGVANVDFVGPVSDVTPQYHAADVVIAPIRAGGGTRIKILEAFAHRRPVVATELGAEGLEVEHEKHLLLASTPAAFARQCARLMSDASLGRRLAGGALQLVRDTYHPDVMKKVLL